MRLLPDGCPRCHCTIAEGDGLHVYCPACGLYSTDEPPRPGLLRRLRDRIAGLRGAVPRAWA